MSRQVTVTVHDVATDGLPDMDSLTGRVAFIFDGCVVSGWPMKPGDSDELWDEGEWEADSDVGRAWQRYGGVKHWVEFPVPVWDSDEAGEAVSA